MKRRLTQVAKACQPLTLLAVLLTSVTYDCPTACAQGLILPTPQQAFEDNSNANFASEVVNPPEAIFTDPAVETIIDSPNQFGPDSQSVFQQHAPEDGLITQIHPDAAPLSSPPATPSPYAGAPFGGPPSAMLTHVAPTPLQRYGYSTPVRINYFAGDNYAEPSSFLAIDMLQPVGNQMYQDGTEVLQYLDGRFGLNTGGGGLLGNLGLGQRVYHAPTDTITDINAWYDVDATRGRVFQQITGGGQIQNQNLLLRGHYYLPVSTTNKYIGMTDLTGNYRFQGNNLALERFRIEDQAFKGYDVEAGLLLPLNAFMARWFVGYYNFEATGAKPLTGYSSTINFDPVPNLTVGLQVTYDEDTEDTGCLFSATYDFYQRQQDPAPNIRHRLGETVRRNRHIVSRQSFIYDPELAEDVNGNIFNFVHVSSAGNSTGTFESPYANLSQAAANALANPNSIIIAHANSVFDGQSVVLPANTRFLGEGIDHSIVTSDSQLQTIVLPRATTGTALPIIRNSPATSPAITMATGTEVNGFQIQNAAGTGIFAPGMTGESSILNTTVTGASTGLHLFENAGNLTITGLSINNTTASGIHIQNSAAASAITFTDALSVNDSGAHGIHFQGNADNSNTTFAGTVAVENTGNHGIYFDNNGDSAIVTFNAATSVTGTTGSGVLISNPDSAAATTSNAITFASSLNISNTAQSGLTTSANDSNVSIQTLAISNWGTSAVAIDGNSGNLVVEAPLALNNINGSLSSTLAITNSSGDLTFSDVTITDTAKIALGQPTVFLQQNNTGLNDITFNTLNVNSSNGTALFGDGTGLLSKLVINGGTITATNGTAVSLNSLATDITFQSVSASNASVGISLTNLGVGTAFHDKFQITGNGTTAGSGGTINNVQTGVLIDGSQDVSLNRMNIDSTVTGVLARANGFNQPEDLTLNRLSLTNAAANANWIGIDVDWNNGAHLSGANVFSNNTITANGADQIGLRIDNNQSNPAMSATIGGNTINLTGPNSTGISLTANGVTPGQTANLGGIALTSTLNNIVNATATPFISTAGNGATITGNILVNGVPRP